MSIYTYRRVEEYLKKFGAEAIYCNKREYYFRTAVPTEYLAITTHTSFLPKASFIERLYCYTNGISARPKCAVCDNEVLFNRNRQYNTHCSQRCSIGNMKALIGCDNASQLESVKDKKRKLSIDKYGVDNVSKSLEVRAHLATRRKEYWDTIYQNKDFSVEGLTRAQYKHRANQYMNTQYLRYKEILDPNGLRSKNWHVDHIYSLTDGFINDVPINVISDISNLRMLPSSENYKKNKSSHKTLDALYEDYQSHRASS